MPNFSNEAPVTLDDVTGQIGAWCDFGFDESVPSEVIHLLQEAYNVCVKELNHA